MNQWANFFSTMAESAATLSGLIFVGISINLSKILSVRALPDRGLESLILLLNILLVSAQVLIPDQSIKWLAARIISTSCVAWFFMIYLDTRIWQRTERDFRRYAIQNMVFSQLAVLPFLIAGICMLSEGTTALHLLVPGIGISFIKALIDAWVLLVEIHR